MRETPPAEPNAFPTTTPSFEIPRASVLGNGANVKTLYVLPLRMKPLSRPPIETTPATTPRSFTARGPTSLAAKPGPAGTGTHAPPEYTNPPGSAIAATSPASFIRDSCVNVEPGTSSG